MNPEDVLGSLLRGALGSRRVRKSSRRTMGAVTRGALSNPKTLLAVAGVAWGLYETWKANQPTGTAGSAAAPPPIPGTPAPPASTDDGVLRLVRLMVSAARADGDLGAEERAAILAEAQKAGVASIVEGELAAPRPLAQIVAGISAPAAKAELYKLAFTIVRADAGVSGAERIYLVQLAHSLGLGSDDVSKLEAEVASAIDGTA